MGTCEHFVGLSDDVYRVGQRMSDAAITTVHGVDEQETAEGLAEQAMLLESLMELYAFASAPAAHAKKCAAVTSVATAATCSRARSLWPPKKQRGHRGEPRVAGSAANCKMAVFTASRTSSKSPPGG